MKLLILIPSLLLLITAHLAFKVDLETKLITDNNGYFRVFHGVNVAQKTAPYFPPILDVFDAQNSFSDEDGALLKQWGMTVVRLTFYWEGVEPTGPGQYDMNYIEKMKQIIATCDRHGIQVYLDLHQDAASKLYCGEGMPDWAIERRTDFPSPFKLNMSYDEQGYPDMKSCLSTGFINFYKSDAIQIAFQDLYDNKRGIRDHFANMWAKIASETKHFKNLLGYEIMNEPFCGHVNKDSTLYETGGNRNLHRLNKAVHEKIRQVDDEKIIFFEGTWTDNKFGSLTLSPGGADYNDRQLFSYHLYCSPLGDPVDFDACKIDLDSQDRIYKGQASQMDVGGILSEFGAISGKPGVGIDVNSYILDLADERFHSWSYWQYKYYNDYTTLARPSEEEGFFDITGKIIPEKLKLLSRPYATQICGKPVKMSFKNGELRISFVNDRKCSNGEFIKFYANTDFYYKNGMVLESSCDECEVKKVEQNYFLIDHSGVEEGKIVEHTIKEKVAQSLF